MSVTHSPSPIAHSPSLGVARWYALRTKSRHEKQVRDRLESQGIEQLLPTVIKLSQWKDRTKKIEVPLFSCYCFAQFAWPDRLAVQQTAERFGVAPLRGADPEALLVGTVVGGRHPLALAGCGFVFRPSGR